MDFDGSNLKEVPDDFTLDNETHHTRQMSDQVCSIDVTPQPLTNSVLPVVRRDST
jgi:hypothetical protein